MCWGCIVRGPTNLATRPDIGFEGKRERTRETKQTRVSGAWASSCFDEAIGLQDGSGPAPCSRASENSRSVGIEPRCKHCPHPLHCLRRPWISTEDFSFRPAQPLLEQAPQTYKRRSGLEAPHTAPCECTGSSHRTGRTASQWMARRFKVVTKRVPSTKKPPKKPPKKRHIHRRIVEAEPVDRRGQHRKVGLVSRVQP